MKEPGDMTVRVLVVDHHAIRSDGRALYRRLAQEGRYEVRVMAPRVWKEYGITSRFDAAPETGSNGAPLPPLSSRFAVVSSRLLFGGKTHRNLYCGLSRELRTFRPDILLVNSEPEGFLALQAVLCRGLHIPGAAVVFTTWRNMPYGAPGEPFPVKWPWLSGTIERYVLPRSAHGIAHSPSAKGIFELKGFREITYIPPYVDPDAFAGSGDRPAQSDLPDPVAGGPAGKSGSAGGPGEVLQVGFVGRLVPEKGVDVLLEAVREIDVPLHLTIAGEGPEKERLRSLIAECGLESRCTMHPPVPHAEIPELMKRFDVLVLPSRRRPGWKEQFGRVLIEAMACGVVVVGSDSGDIPRVIADAGFVFPEGDSRALREVLRRLYADPTLRESSRRAGIRKVAEEYALPVAVGRYRRLLDSLKFRREIRTIQENAPQQSPA